MQSAGPDRVISVKISTVFETYKQICLFYAYIQNNQRAKFQNFMFWEVDPKSWKTLYQALVEMYKVHHFEP